MCRELVSKAGRGTSGVALAAGLGHGLTYLVQFCLYFTAFVAGARLMVWNGYGFDDVIKVFLSIAFAGDLPKFPDLDPLQRTVTTPDLDPRTVTVTILDLDPRTVTVTTLYLHP